MAKYRKKPVVIEAYQTEKEIVIDTLEAQMKANVGDWIITGVAGERYPCKPDIFAATYEWAGDADVTDPHKNFKTICFGEKWDSKWEETWKPLLLTDGKFDEEKINNEMHDLVFVLTQVSEVYQAVTGGRLSKEMYFASTVIAEYYEQIQKATYEAGEDEDTGSISDGYHTFDELYEHRVVLFIALCDVLRAWSQTFPVWRSKLHSDGSSFDGWFIMGIFKEKGKQITYHLPMESWASTAFADTLDKAPEFDGHTHEDVLVRLSLYLP